MKRMKNNLALGDKSGETLEALTRVNVMVRYVMCSHLGSKSLSVSIRSHYGVENRSHAISTCNDLMPEVFSYEVKKSNWPLPFKRLKRKGSSFYVSPKRICGMMYEKLIGVVTRPK